MDGLYRSERRIPSGSDSSSESEVFEVYGRRESLAVQGSLLRSVHGASGLHPGYGSGVRLSSSAGRPDVEISGRLADNGILSGGSLLGKGQGSPTFELGIVVNLDKSSLTPSQVIVYLGIKIESQTFWASPTPSRIEKFFSIVEEFLSSKVQSAKFWRVLLWHLASLMHLVPGGQLRMRALQLALKRGWNFVDDSVLVPWDAPSRDDLLWWCAEGRLEEGMSLAVPSPDHMFWSDASDQGWGAMVADQFASGLWLEGEDLSSINHRELLAVERGLFQLQKCLKGHVVAVFSDNTTSVAYLCHQGGTLSATLNSTQWILHWAEREKISICPQFVPWRNNVVADALSRPNQVAGTEWTLHQEVFNSLHKRWPVVIDLFASSLNHCCGVYFAPVSDPIAAGTDAMLQSWDHLLGYAFPPFAMIHQVLRKLRESSGAVVTLVAPFWPQKEWFPDLLELLLEPPLLLPERWDLLRQPHVCRYHQHLSVLRLHAWRLSRDLCEPPDCLLEWLNDLALSVELR